MFSKIKDAALANAFISSSGLPHLRCPYHPDQSQRAAGQLISLFATLPIRCFLSDVERKPERRQSVSNYVESPPRMCCGGQKKTKRKKKENNLPFNRMTDMMVRGDREENDGASSLAVRRKTHLGALWGSESPRGHPPCPQPSPPRRLVVLTTFASGTPGGIVTSLQPIGMKTFQRCATTESTFEHGIRILTRIRLV